MSAHQNTMFESSARSRDLLRFIAMATGVGIITGIILILLVILLSTPAQASSYDGRDVFHGELLFSSEGNAYTRIAASLELAHIKA